MSQRRYYCHKPHLQLSPTYWLFGGDDIGISKISAYRDGIIGYRTPNIDRIAIEGVHFTDYYGDQSCTAGRSTFITGQSGLRTGLTKVGLPGAEVGLQSRDITIAEMLKAKGYTTGQFGKNHFGDKDEHLPSNHDFDEFLGDLYHLNAEEEPEDPDYPKDPAFIKQFGPRGVIRQVLQTFKKYPSSQEPNSWSVNKLTENILTSKLPQLHQ